MKGERSRDNQKGGRNPSGQAEFVPIGEPVPETSVSSAFLALKRIGDFTGAVLLLVLLSPLMLAIALAIKLDSEGPVIFRQERYGYGMEPFEILKFRTMVTNAERMGARITPEEDPRITRVGSWLRRTKLDELPQLFNILKGEMSFVGPRPQTTDYADAYFTDYRNILEVVPPGVTDYASVRYRNEAEILNGTSAEEMESFYLREILPDKLELHYAYLQNMGIRFDVKILFWTLLAVFTPGLFERVTEQQSHEEFSPARPDLES